MTAAAAVAVILITRHEKKPHAVGTLHQEGAEFYINVYPDKPIPRCKVFADTTQLKVRGEDIYEEHLSGPRNYDLPSSFRQNNPEIINYSGKDIIEKWWLDSLLFKKKPK